MSFLGGALERVPGAEAALGRILQYLGEAAGDKSVPIDTFAREVIRHSRAASKLIMNSFEKFTEKARNEGLAKGLEKGRAEGLREALLRLLHAKFGELGSEHVARVEQADERTVRRFIDRADTADSIDAALGG